MKARPFRFCFLLCSFLLYFGKISLCGQIVTVKDVSGTLLPGVEVYTDDFSIGEISDDNGQVDLSGISQHARINFRFLGYRNKVTSLKEISPEFVVVMTQTDQLIEEVIVLGRKEISQRDIPYAIKSIKIEDIRSTHAQTSADALSQHGGVYIQKSQMGGGSPVIRGFEANRVLLVLDGVRLNNAIYRNGHLQNAITVDQAMLDKMDVLFGPNSLIYGSDALGGVVNFKTKDPLLSRSSKLITETNFYTRFASANDEKSGHIDFSVGGKKLGSLTSVTFSSYGDLRSGSKRDNRFPDFGKRNQYQGVDENGFDIAIMNENVNVQVGSSYDQLDLFQKLVWQPSIHQKLTTNIQYSTSTDIPRYDNLSEERNGELRWAEWNYGPQRRLLTSLDYRNFKPTQLYDQVIVIGAFQRIDEDRIFRRFGDEVRTIQEEDVDVLSVTADMSKYLNDNELIELEYGADIQYNNVKSSALGENVQSGEITFDQLTRYANDENKLTNVGAYFYLRGRSKNKYFTYNAGLRFSNSSYLIRYTDDGIIEWPNNFYDGIDGNNSALTWSIGSTWDGTSGLQVRTIISTAFRSPNIDDLSKIRINGNEITFPNADLKPEKSTNAEITIAYQKGLIKNLSLTTFYTRLTDAIVRAPFTTPQQTDILITQGDTLQVVANQNIQQGAIYGVSFNVVDQKYSHKQVKDSFHC